ncbi:MAG: ABC transporter permease [Armatimonadota bacterium]|nr:ABC transporter permease [Armatimonadota bacterium]
MPITALDLVLFAFPMAILAVVSFLQVHEFELTRQVTVKNYLFFLGNWVYLRVLLKTAVIAAVVTAVCLVLGYPFAYYLTQISRRWQRTALALVILPFWTSYLLRVYAWMTILGERGLVNKGLLMLGAIDEPVRFLLYNNVAVVIVSVYLYLPYSALALYTALERFDRSLVRAAMDLGAQPIQTFRHVVLPLTLPGVMASFIFVFIPMLGEFITPTLVGGTEGILIVNIVVSQLRALRFGTGAAMTFVIAALVVVLLLALRRVVNIERVFSS